MAVTGFAEFSFVLTRVHGRATITIEGELDAYTAPRLREALADVTADGERDVVLDIRGVTFLDSTGLGSIVSGHRRLADQGGTLTLRRPAPSVYKVIEMTGLHRVIPVADD